jgi:hypothetical protein
MLFNDQVRHQCVGLPWSGYSGRLILQKAFSNSGSQNRGGACAAGAFDCHHQPSSRAICNRLDRMYVLNHTLQQQKQKQKRGNAPKQCMFSCGILPCLFHIAAARSLAVFCFARESLVTTTIVHDDNNHGNNDDNNNAWQSQQWQQ